MRRIVEEPDIVPASAGRSWLPGFGNLFATAVGQFSFRTILRSRQHRLLLAFYLGMGFAFAIFLRTMDEAAQTTGHTVGLGLLASTVLILLLSIIGARVAFSLPTDMRANWAFRIAPIPAGPEVMIARRRALYGLSVLPVCAGAAAVLFTSWPWQMAAKHVTVLALLGVATAELCLHGRQKLPFTCSYLPGKSNMNISFLLCSLGIFGLIVQAAREERDSFDSTPAYTLLIGLLATLAIAARWSASRLARSPEGVLQFEEAAEPAVFVLDLHRDGVTSIEVTSINSAVTDTHSGPAKSEPADSHC
jgi:hypothetical protein